MKVFQSKIFDYLDLGSHIVTLCWGRCSNKPFGNRKENDAECFYVELNFHVNKWLINFYSRAYKKNNDFRWFKVGVMDSQMKFFLWELQLQTFFMTEVFIIYCSAYQWGCFYILFLWVGFIDHDWFNIKEFSSEFAKQIHIGGRAIWFSVIAITVIIKMFKKFPPRVIHCRSFKC